MKVYRLLGILTTLLQNKKVTAPYLAEKFEVSRRTINRDIEDICKAGIPIVTTQGFDGGISIAKGYKIDKSVFTKQEIEDVLTALKGLYSVSYNSKYGRLIEKFQPNNKIYSLTENILIDLSSHYKDSLAPKIGLIKSAITDRNLIRFNYFYSKGQVRRTIEPYLVVFRWSSWYVFGYCTEKKGFRLFKLNRLWELEKLKEYYEEKEFDNKDVDFNRFFTNEINLVAKFDQKTKYRLIEDYGINCFTIERDDRLLFKWGFTNRETMISWLLGFGDSVEVIEPAEIRYEIINKAKDILNKYN
ncbi:YafY family protein [Clostridiaceae bacterium M8S5]|nr:YafY family protein [Clostridiaceae bacterium M8S5]